MAKCRVCGKHGIFLRVSKDGLCPSCANAQLTYKIQKRREEERQREIEWERERQREIELEQEMQRTDEEGEKLERLVAEKRRKTEEILASAVPVDIHISDELAPKTLSKDQTNILYSTITKKSNRSALGNFVVIDTETTGVRPSSCEIIDIAAIRFRNFEPVEKFVTLCSAKKPISEQAQAVNHITEEMLEGKPLFQQVATSLVDFVGADNLVGHNLPFDLSFIFRYGGHSITATKRKYFDTLEIARKTVRKAKYKWDKEFESYEYDPWSGIENHKLETLCQWYGIMNVNPHRAEGDAFATGILFKKLVDERCPQIN